LSEIKQSTQSFDWEIFHPREIHELEVSKQYQIEITNRFAALEKLSVDEDINMYSTVQGQYISAQIEAA
jgi:hypothetical protein